MSNNTTTEEIEEYSDKIYDFSQKIEFFVDILSIIINTFHVFVLTRKSMRTNCVNILMAGIGICDIFVSGFNAREYINLLMYADTVYECTPPATYTYQIVDQILVATMDIFRRLSAWLSLVMAFVRYLAIKNALNSKFDFLSQPVCGVKIIIVSFLLSVLVNSFFFNGIRFRISMVEWTPAETCEGFPPNYSIPYYMPYIQKMFFLDTVEKVSRVFSFMDGTLKFTPTLIFPILTFMLVQNLRNAEKLRRKSSTSKGADDNSKTDQTTKLVILIAITYMTAEGPSAIGSVLGSLKTGPDLLLKIISYLKFLITLNTITHLFICLAISSQYQKAVKDIFRRRTPKNCVIACVGVFINIFHLIVLSKKSITKNSINVIMIGIGLCDLLNMAFNVIDTTEHLMKNSDKCRPPPPYLWKVIGFWAAAFEDHSRRLSSLFGVLMASTRYLVIRNALNPKFDWFSKPKFALLAMSIAFLCSTLLTMFFWSRYRFVEVKPWKPPIQCTGYPFGYTAPQYRSSLEDIFLTESTPLLQVFSVVDGMVKIIPTIMFPILTILLIKELKKAANTRKKTSAHTAENKEESSKTDQTTKLVAFMAICYIIAEGPVGILYVIQGVVLEPYGIVEMTVNLIDIFGTFFSLNAIMHPVICLTVSSQYKKSAKELFCFGKCTKRKTTPVPKHSVTINPSARTASAK